MASLAACLSLAELAGLEVEGSTLLPYCQEIEVFSNPDPEVCDTYRYSSLTIGTSSHFVTVHFSTGGSQTVTVPGGTSVIITCFVSSIMAHEIAGSMGVGEVTRL